MNNKSLSKAVLYLYGIGILLFLYLPIVAVGFASVSKARYLRFPIRKYATGWYEKAIQSDTVADLLFTSLTIAAIVTIVSLLIGFFGALAFARYEWRFRRLYQKLILLPIFFPQTVLGLALLMWFNALDIIPSWQTAIVAHLVWITPIVTLIIAIRAYSFDSSLEDAARDMGCSNWQIMKEVTVPLLLPAVISAGLFAFLLSWGIFPYLFSPLGRIQHFQNGFMPRWFPDIHLWFPLWECYLSLLLPWLSSLHCWCEVLCH